MAEYAHGTATVADDSNHAADPPDPAAGCAAGGAAGSGARTADSVAGRGNGRRTSGREHSGYGDTNIAGLLPNGAHKPTSGPAEIVSRRHLLADQQRHAHILDAAGRPETP